jgi:hypothetical protein
MRPILTVAEMRNRRGISIPHFGMTGPYGTILITKRNDNFVTKSFYETATLISGRRTFFYGIAKQTNSKIAGKTVSSVAVSRRNAVFNFYSAELGLQCSSFIVNKGSPRPNEGGNNDDSNDIDVQIL